MRNKLLFVLVSFLYSFSAFASTPVWSTDVAPILYNHCTQCHHNGGIAPFPLMNYGDAFTNAISISHDVSTGDMPPWPPNKDYSRFAHERLLSTAEVNTIEDWVAGGAPSGTISLAPPAPVYTLSGDLPGVPDLIIKIPPYTSTATTATGDIYQCFAIPSGLLADKYITAFEAIPGNAAMVHHVLVFSDTTGACAHLDSMSPGPGYLNFGGVGSSSATMVGAWVPGSAPMAYPNGFGLRLPHNSDVVLQIHYPAGTVGLTDTTEVHFFFSSSPTLRDVYINPVLNYYTNIDSPIDIPANTIKTYHEHQLSPFDVTFIGLAPHMHLIGTKINCYGVLPSGDTDRYIDIPKWDFHWQGFYSFRKLKRIPPLTTVYADATYDNTSANPENPSSPPQRVVAGENTTNEMMLVYFVYAQYQPGDENIIVDSSILGVNNPTNYYHGQQLLGVSPNPAVNEMVVKCYLEEADMATIQLIDMQGRVVKELMQNGQIAKGYNTFAYPITNIAAGTYSLTMRTSQRILSQKVVVVK